MDTIAIPNPHDAFIEAQLKAVGLRLEDVIREKKTIREQKRERIAERSRRMSVAKAAQRKEAVQQLHADCLSAGLSPMEKKEKKRLARECYIKSMTEEELQRFREKSREYSKPWARKKSQKQQNARADERVGSGG